VGDRFRLVRRSDVPCAILRSIPEAESVLSPTHPFTHSLFSGSGFELLEVGLELVAVLFGPVSGSAGAAGFFDVTGVGGAALDGGARGGLAGE
jgi:hypothetical protein